MSLRHIGSDREVGRDVVTIVHHGMSPSLYSHARLVFERRDFTGPRIDRTDCPAGNIDVMSAPVGELSARVLVPVSEGVVAVAIKRHAAAVALSHLREELDKPLALRGQARYSNRVRRER